jgi:hypothetical protein
VRRCKEEKGKRRDREMGENRQLEGVGIEHIVGRGVRSECGSRRWRVAP